jgi:hypothetical protein
MTAPEIHAFISVDEEAEKVVAGFGMTTNDGDWLISGFANEDVDDNC